MRSIRRLRRAPAWWKRKLIEGEEFDAPRIHHKSDEHDLEEYEEEEKLHTQIRSGELGEMLQEAHLDHRIQLNFDDKNGEADGGRVRYEDEEEEEEPRRRPMAQRRPASSAAIAAGADAAAAGPAQGGRDGDRRRRTVAPRRRRPPTCPSSPTC